MKTPDESHELDFVVVFERPAGSSDAMEPLAVKNLLESNGIYAVMDETPVTSLSQEVRVAREHAGEAQRLIAEALATGPAGAEEAEREGEKQN